MAYRRLAARLRTPPPSCGAVRVIAVDGPSGAGKSTFAHLLASAMDTADEPATPVSPVSPVTVVGSDDFRVPWDADPLTWWNPLARDVLEPLAAGRPGTLRRYDWHRDTFGPEETVPAEGLLILEGVGAAWRDSPAAYRIWVDAPRAVRRARALERDGAEYADAWDAWAERETRHFTADGTRDRADLLVDGTDLTGPALTYAHRPPP